MDNCKNAVIMQLSPEYRPLFQNVSFEDLEEIRFRIGRPIMLYRHDRAEYITEHGNTTLHPDQGKIARRADINALSAAFCSNSVYAYVNDIKNGFITLQGGHRVGLAGKCVIKNGEITNMTDIAGINLRIARPYTGCAEAIAPQLRTGHNIKNTLLIAPPQCGKTTFLRDLARIFSVNFKVTIVDERSEIAGTYEGVPQFNIGPQTDVLDRFPKAHGMRLAVRSLSPHILITDELGKKEDIEAMEEAASTGCRFIASIHGDSTDFVLTDKNKLLSFFDVAIILGRKNNRPAIINIKHLR